MNATRTALKQGVSLTYIPCDKFTGNFFSVHFLMPLSRENAAAYSLLAKVLKRGSRLYPTQELIAKRSEELYAARVVPGTLKLGEVQSFFVSSTCLDNSYAFDGMDIGTETFALLSSVLKDPYLENGVFSATVLAREKRSLCDRIRSRINNKETYALRRCQQIMCENEPYRFLLDGDVEDVEKITATRLFEIYNDILANARVEMFYIGRESFDAVQARAGALCDSLKPRSDAPLSAEIIRGCANVRHVCESANAVQGKLVMGFRTAVVGDEEDADALMLFDTVFGASPISKLFMNVRERMSLCYYCSSKCDMNKGVMFVAAGIENENAKVTEQEILHQLSECAAGNVDEKELSYAKKAIRDTLLSLADSPAGLEGWYLSQAVRKSVRTPEEVLAHVEKLTVEDVSRVAARITLDTVYFLSGDADAQAKEEDDA